MATLTLNMLRCPDAVMAEQRQVQGGELTLGRGSECGWTLSDPAKSLSRRHCTLEFYAGAWQVRDLSANGTFVNFDNAPVGRDMVKQLHDGDRLRLGDYEIEVRIEAERYAAPPALPTPFGAPSPSETPLHGGFGAVRLPGLDDPPAGAALPFGQAARAPSPSLFGSATADHSASASDAFIPPAAVPSRQQEIPEDWWKSPAPAPVPAPGPRPGPGPTSAPVAPVFDANPFAPGPSTPPPASAPPPLVTPPMMPPAVMAAPATALPATAGTPAQEPAAAGQHGAGLGAGVATPTALTGGLDALLAGGDVSADLVVRATADPEATLRNAGMLLRAAVTGLRALLIARGSVKREFRIEQTMLRPSDNNPLKFAASDEQAMAALLDPRSAALKAVQESVNDLSLHQVATLAATQAAARALLERLSPEKIESEDPGGGLMPGARERRLWEAYKRQHATLLGQFEDDFESAFGTAFARAYEQAAGHAKGGD